MTVEGMKFDFDPDALTKKYREERDKRLREDGTAQFVKMEGQFAHYLTDPYMEKVERDPIGEELEVAILTRSTQLESLS